MLIDTFASAAPAYFRSGTALELVSGPGLGKSSVMLLIAANLSRALGKPFGVVTNILSQMDPVDIKGFCIPVKDPDNPRKVDARFTSPSVFPHMWNIVVFVDGAIDESYNRDATKNLPEHGILFLDEFGQSSMETQKVAAQLLLDKRIGEFSLPAGWVVWAASNRLSDKSGVNKRLSFVQNRMKTLNLQPAYAPWEAWAIKNGIHPITVSFAKKNPSSVFRDEVPADPGPFCTPRSLVLCTQDLQHMVSGETHKLPDDEVALETVQGWLGDKVAVEFMSHVRIGNDLPDVEQVVKAPKETKVPERPDARFVMSMMLAHHATMARMTPLVTYVKRMDVEMQVLFIRSVGERNPALFADKAASAWVSSNQDLLQAAYSVKG